MRLNNTILYLAVATLLVVCSSCGQPKKLAEASPAPLASIESVNAEELNAWITKQKGKIVLVDYWATWCVPCVEKFPKIILLEEKYRDRGLDVVAINMNEQSDLATVSKFLEVYKPSFTQMIAKGKTSEAFEDFNLESLPTYRLHRPDGEIVKTFDGNSDIAEIEAAIADLVK